MSSPVASTAPAWRSRAVGSGTEAPEQLLANPANYRVHPKAQQDALAGVLDQVGWVQNVLVNQGTGHVVDGHLRIALAISRGEPSVPVLYVDLSEEGGAARPRQPRPARGDGHDRRGQAARAARRGVGRR